MSTSGTIKALKEANEDFEWYPTTDRIISRICNDMDGYDYHSRATSVLDIGAGDGRVLTAIHDKMKAHQSNDNLSLYAIEKATVHLSNMPKDIHVIGTDFYQQTLVDKSIDVVFCNPPYSEFEAWTLRILQEASASHVYLVIPRRWRDNVDIQTAMETRSAKVTSLGEFDFVDGDRSARALVEVIHIRFSYSNRDAFDTVLETMLPELDVFTRDKSVEADEDVDVVKPEVIESSENIVEAMVMAYDAELNTLIENYRGACKVDYLILKELGVTKSSVLEAIRLKIKGLKNKYWRNLFAVLKTVTKRLATKQRKAFLDSLQRNVRVDFTESNVYAILIWVSKWANDYYDEQLVELFQTLSNDSCVIKYKSNQRVWTQGDWMYQSNRENNKASHYRLEYRMVISHGGIGGSNNRFNGLTERAYNLLNDIVTVANNLGIDCDDSPGNHKWERNSQRKLRKKDGQPLVAVRAYYNGNMHLHFDPKFMLAVNVEAGRLLGWIRNPFEACDEFEVSGDEAASVAELFGSSFHISPTAGLNIGHVVTPEVPAEPEVTTAEPVPQHDDCTKQNAEETPEQAAEPVPVDDDCTEEQVPELCYQNLF